MSSVKSVSLSQVRGLTTSEVASLKAQGIKTTAQLLAAAPTSTAQAALARKSGLTSDEVHEAVNRADLIRVAGMGPATADLFENAGVNSAAELSRRNAANLYATLEHYAQAHPDAHVPVPSQQTVASLINGAKLVVAPAPAPAPLTQAQAAPIAGKAIDAYIDQVLFNPAAADGATFRSNVLEGHTQAEQDQIRARLHAAVPAFLSPGGDPAVADSGTVWTFTGRLDGLYTEVDVTRDGKVPRVMVEID